MSGIAAGQGSAAAVALAGNTKKRKFQGETRSAAAMEVDNEDDGNKKAATAATGINPSKYMGLMTSDRLAAVTAFYTPLFPSLEKGSREFVDAIDVAILFAVVDSIHDFWPERKTKGEEEEGDDDSLTEEARAARIADVRAKLVASINRFLGLTSPLPIETILSRMTDGNVRSTSNIEDNTIAYVKKTFYPFNQAESFITVATILKDWTFENPRFAAPTKEGKWERYSTELLKLSNRLQIRPEGKSIKSLSNTELNAVAFFILGYMNPNAQPGAGTLANFTFDMSPRDVGKIFARIPQAYNALFPQNVSDSASTSFSALLGRARYFRANGDVAGTPGAVVEPFRSNAFTGGKYTFQFNDTGFNKGNEYGFSIDIRGATPDQSGTIKFGKGGGQQGPSVNYLMDIIHKPKTLRTIVPKLPQVAKLNALPPALSPEAPARGQPDYNALFDVLFDIKRGGDHEQMRRGEKDVVAGGGVQTGGAKEAVVGVTGDRMAKQFRDLVRMTGMYHSTVGPIDISRFLAGAVSADILAAQALDFRRQSVLGKLNIVSAGQTGAGRIYDALVAMRAEVVKGFTTGAVFIDPIPIPNPDAIFVDHTKSAATAAAYMLRLRMIDIYRHINSLLSKSRAIGPEGSLGAGVEGAKPIVSVPLATTDELTGLQLENAIKTLETFIDTIGELESMKISFDTTKTSEPINVKLFEGTRLIKGATSSLFNFSAGPYLQPETGLMPTIARLLMNRTARRPEAIKVQILAQRDQYFAARDLAKEAFFDQELKDAVEAATDITTGISVAKIVGQDARLPGEQGIVEVLLNLDSLLKSEMTKLEAVAAPAGPGMVVDDDTELGGGGRQTGGAGSPLQFRDMHDLLVEICLDASNALTRISMYGTPEEIQAELSAAAAALPALEAEYTSAKAVIEAKAAAGAMAEDGAPTPEEDRLDAAEDSLYVGQSRFANAKLASEATTTAVNDIEIKWLTGIDELRAHALDEYEVAFEETVATDIISFILSFRTIKRPTGVLDVDYGNTFAITDKSVYADMNETITRTAKSFGRDVVIIEDIRGIFLQKIPVEPVILEVLGKIGRDILNPVMARKSGTKPVAVVNTEVVTKYASPTGWDGVPALIYAASGFDSSKPLPPSLRSLLRGGGLEGAGEEPVNAGGSSSGSSRRGLYSGLRKRGGAGSPPEL